MIEVQVEGIERLQRVGERLAQLLSPIALTERVLVIAKEAGVALHAASVRACMEAIYDQPASLTYDRTGALLRAHRLSEQDGGFTQVIDIDPDAVPDPGSRSLNDAEYRERWVTAGRERVLDYAIPVHDGYVQWIFGQNTGEFHPGRFWFDVAGEEAGPIIGTFLEQAFAQIIGQVVLEAAA